MTAWCLWWRVSAAGLRLRTVAREREVEGSSWPAARVGVGGAAPQPPLYGGLAGCLGPSSKPLGWRLGGRVGGKSSPPPLLEGSLRVSPKDWPAGPLGPCAPGPKWPGHFPLGPCRPPTSGPMLVPLWNLLEPSGTIPINSKTIPESKNCFPLYESYSPDHSGTSRDVLDLI
jgi:hypothetical protein